jgi:hypothetical protein
MDAHGFVALYANICRRPRQKETSAGAEFDWQLRVRNVPTGREWAVRTCAGVR